MVLHVIHWHMTKGSYIFFGKKYFVEHSHLDPVNCKLPAKILFHTWNQHTTKGISNPVRHSEVCGSDFIASVE